MKILTIILFLLFGAFTLASDDAPLDCYYDNYGAPLTVATNGIWKPWTFLEGGELKGWDIDFMTRVMKTIGVDFDSKRDMVQKNWGEGCCEILESGEVLPPDENIHPYFWSLYSGEVDLGISASSNSERRTVHIPASDRYGYLEGFATFAVLKDSAAEFQIEIPNQELEALDSLKIGISGKGANQDAYLKLVLAERKDLNFEIVYGPELLEEFRSELEKTIESPTVSDALLFGLKNKDLDVLFGSAFVEQSNEIEEKGFVKEFDYERFERVWGTGTSIFFNPEGDPKLIDAVNCAIEKISTETPEFYDELREKYSKGFNNPNLEEE